MAENKVTQLQKQILKLTETINKNGEATKKQVQQLKNLEKQYERLNGKLMPQYRKRHDEVNEALKKSSRYTKDASKQTTNFGTRIKGAIKTLGAYGAAYRLINFATQAFSSLTLGSIKQSIAFEKALANLGAVAGATAKEVKQLGDNALDVAGKTKFTSQEIVSLQTELSKLGFTSKEVVASTEAIAFTAQALGAPLDATAQQIGKIINQFGLLIEQSGFVGDVLVTTINNSALSMDSFGTAIQYVGPIAKNLGLTLEQTSGAMAVLSDNGFTASRVGTGLRGIFTELGKTSADVEASLNSLAEQNISLSEAVDLVGKRNASQLITLLDNIDAIDESTTKYYEQGRSLESAAKQADTFSGQIEILTANYKEFQIGIGNVIAESNILLGVLDILFKKGAQTSRAFKVINEVGFEEFSKGAERVADGADVVEEALSLAGISAEDYSQALSNAVAPTNDISKRLFSIFEDSEKTVNTIDGLVKALRKLSLEQSEQESITLGQTEATDAYSGAVKELTDNFEKGIYVNAEASRLFEDIGDSIKYEQQEIKRLNGEIKINNAFLKTNKNLNESEKKALEDKNEQLRLSVLQYKGSIEQMKGYQDQLTNVQISTEQLAAKLEKINNDIVNAEAKRIKEQIKAIDENTKNRVAALQEQAKIDTFAAKSAEERADIERKLLLDVSKAYDEKAASIRAINVQEEENKRLVKDAIKLAQKQAEILGSTVISDATKALKDYASEFEKVKDQYLEGNIGLDEYRSSLKDTQDDYRKYIQSLIDSGEVSDQVIEILLSLADAYDEVSSSSEEVVKNTEKVEKKTEEGKKSWEDFKEEFKDTGWSDIAMKAVDALGDSLGAFNDTALENVKASSEAQLDVIKSRYEIEDDILKSQLDNELITESQFRSKQKELRKSQIAEENAIEKNVFNAKKRQDKNDAGLEGIEAAAQAYIEAFKNYEPATAIIVGSIGAGIAAAQTTAQISAINQRKYYDKKFADGGIVNGPSHDQGGVPFTVQGRGGYEMEGGEYIVNKRATSMHRDLLERINKSGKMNPTVGRMKFAEGGLVSSPLNESVDYLKAIAEATTSTAIQTSKPVRAFVTSSDLRTNETERRLRDRNDKI